jgi:serpin B
MAIKIVLGIGVILLLFVGVGLFYNFYSESKFSDVPAEIKDLPLRDVKILDDSNANSENINGVVNANNKFALDFYKEINSRQEGNLFFSPYSISTALAMTYEGAKGKTADEMREVFYFPEDDLTRRAGYAKTYNDINKKEKSYELSTANALWAEQTYSFLDDYFNVIENFYGGEVVNMDFLNKPDEERERINEWVEYQTKDKIKDLLSPGSVTPGTRLVLTNAIYFKGDWVVQFDEDDTYEEDFKVSQDETIKVNMMNLVDKKEEFNYAELDDMQVLELDYDGDEVSMLILLPKESLEDVENSLTVERLDEVRSSLNSRVIDIYIPKFKFETKYELNRNLQNLGMSEAFNPEEADFSGMSGNRNLFISGVIHQAYIDVNEQGTEAAAATAVVMELTGMPDMYSDFRADHPFIFLIQEKNNGNILFMGKIVNPEL